LSEYLVSLKIEKLEEGVYLATSDTLQGLGLCRANPCLFKGGIQPVPIDTFIYI